jgi:hypothetical protein
MRELQARVDSLRAQRNALDADLQRQAKQLDLVRQMIAIADGQALPLPVAEVSAAQAPPFPVSKVRESVKLILREISRPLHISEIHREFLQRGFPIPGSGTPFNILAHIVRDKELVRVARGTYALREGMPGVLSIPLPKVKKRRRRRKPRRL